MPVIGYVSDPPADLSQPRTPEDQGGVGWCRSNLANNITVQLAATEHAGLYSYDFPMGTNTSYSVVVDVSHALLSFRGLGWEQHYSGGTFKLLNDGHYEGSGTYSNGWNLLPDWTIYFCGRLSRKAASSRIFSENIATDYNSTCFAGTVRLGGRVQLG